MGSLDLFWQAAIFSSLALGIPLACAVWLFFSPMKQTINAGQYLDRTWATRFALMIGGCVLAMNVGAYWDASEHSVTGVVPGGKDFLWPPHLVLYGGFLLVLIVALMALVAVAGPNLRAGIRDPRVWVRRNPLLGAVTLSAGYAIFSIPGDAIWHQLFGVDLTAWSPPHLILGFSIALVGVCSAALLAQTNKSARRDLWRDGLVVAILALVLSETFLVGVVEWEVTGNFAAHNSQERAIWLYPVVSAGLSFLILDLARHLTRLKWAATLTAITFFVIRLAVIGGMALINGVSPHLPLVFVLGAVTLDIVKVRVQSRVMRALSIATVYSIGFAMTAFPNLALLGLGLGPVEYIEAFAVTLVLVAILYPLVEVLGTWFERQRLPIPADGPITAPAPAN